MDKSIRYVINPSLSKEELFQFYQDNTICEEGYGMEVASRVLDHSSLIIAAYQGDRLIATTRSMFDGVAAQVVEFCLAVDFQGKDLVYENGSILEKDDHGIAKEMAKLTINKLLNMGAYFISSVAFEEAEKEVYTASGFTRNHGHIDYVYEKRPYVPKHRHSADL